MFEGSIKATEEKNIIQWPKQLIAHADDIALTDRDSRSLEETLLELEEQIKS